MYPNHPTHAQLRCRHFSRSVFSLHYTKGPVICGHHREFYLVTCNYCGSKYTWFRGSGHGTLLRHVSRCHSEQFQAQNQIDDQEHQAQVQVQAQAQGGQEAENPEVVEHVDGIVED